MSETKNGDRFSFQIRSSIFKSQSRSRSRSKTVPEKSVIDFHFKIDQRFPDQNRIPFFVLKTIRDGKIVSGIKIQTERKIGSRFPYENRSPIFKSKSICDFHSGIDQHFSDQNRDHDRDRKLFQKN